MSSIIHPLWLVGFRPFFALACLSGMLLPIAWALMFSGALRHPEQELPALCQRLLAAMAEPADVAGHRLPLAGSILTAW